MKTKPGRVKRFFWLAVGLVVAALLIKWFFFAAPPPPTYATATVKRADLEDSVLASGTLEAMRQVSVGAQVSGQLKVLKVALGDEVRQNQLVAEIDDMTQQNELRTTQAALDTRRAELRARQATLRQAEQAYTRERRMLAVQASSREAFDKAEAALAVARAEIAASQAQIDQAAIEVDKARVNVGYTRILSPMDGMVVAVITKEGQTVNSIQSAPTIIKVAQMDTMTVKAQISEADVTRVKPGQKVYFTILAEPDTRHYGTLRAVEPAPDSIQRDETSAALTGGSTAASAAVYYNGLFDVPNPDGVLRISMTAQVFIVLGEATQVLQIPSSALGGRDADGRYAVRVVEADGQVQTRQVRIGLNNNVMAQVLDGLQEGEQVISADAAMAPAEPA